MEDYANVTRENKLRLSGTDFGKCAATKYFYVESIEMYAFLDFSTITSIL